MNEMMHLLTRRRSVVAGKMSGPGPSDALLEDIMAAGLRVPDHGKLGPWRFIVIKGEARKALGRTVADAFAQDNPEASGEDIAFEAARFTRAPVVIAVACRIVPVKKIPEWEQILSCGAACQNLLLASHASGFVAQWLTEWYAYSEVVKDALGLSGEDRIAGFIYIGSADEAPKERVRPSLEEVATVWTPD